MDITHESLVMKDSLKSYNYMLGGKITHFTIYDFRHPIKKRKHKKTTYYYFKCRIVSRDHKKVPFGNHIIQLPSKRVVLPLFELIDGAGRIDDAEIKVTIERINNYEFNIMLH